MNTKLTFEQLKDAIRFTISEKDSLGITAENVHTHPVIVKLFNDAGWTQKEFQAEANKDFRLSAASEEFMLRYMHSLEEQGMTPQEIEDHMTSIFSTRTDKYS